MSLRTVLAAILAGVAIGVLAFLLQMTQSVDGNLHRERLARIGVVDSLDVALNRAFTQTRSTAMGDPTADRAAITAQLGKALDAIDRDQGSLRGLSGELDKKLGAFLDTIEAKFELGADFEARNSLLTQRLINSMDSVPTHAAELLTQADPAIAEQLQPLLTTLKAEVVAFGVTPMPGNAQAITDLLAQIDQIAQNQPEPFLQAVQVLRARCQEVLADKGELVDKLRSFLDRPTGPQLREVQESYNAWYQGQVAIANQYRIYLAAYAATLLLVLAWLGWRLSRSYRDLDRANAQLSTANERLEEQVTERTKDLTTALKELKASQAQLIQSEKMASLGTMVAGVAHEINTPLGYARSNTEIVRGSLSDLRELIDAQDKALTLITNGESADEDVAQALTEADLRRQTLDPGVLMDELGNLLQDTDHGLLHIADLVSTLKDFSRVDRSRHDLFDVNVGLESALKIAHNQIKHHVEVVKHYGQLPQIECSPSQLNQVFLNLFTNAGQAIDGQGQIFIATAAENNGVVIRVRDTGCGMSEEVRAHIFEPFFTTKPVGKGTGLGLSIVFRIIEEHGGRIDVQSEVGKGTEFIIHLPTRQARAKDAAPRQDNKNAAHASLDAAAVAA